MNRMILAGLAGTCFAALLAAKAETPKNALGAIAVSPDGATLIAAGDNRVLYVLDPASLEVKQRVHLGINPLEAAFSKDGATLAIFDTDGDVHLLATADWSTKLKVKGGEAFAISAGADSFAALARPSKSGEAFTTAMTVYSLGDGAKKLEATIPGKAKSLVSVADGSGYAILTERQEDTAETKEKAPADLKGMAKEEFEQKHDGYTSEIVMLDGTGKETARTATWFTSYATLTGSIDGGIAYFLGYQNDNLKIAADGTTSLFQLAPSFLYGIGISPDGKKAAAGSLRDGTVHDLAGGSGPSYKLDDQDGWPEYFEGFGFAPDGSVYGGTTAYRLAHIGADGVIKTVKSIY